MKSLYISTVFSLVFVEAKCEYGSSDTGIMRSSTYLIYNLFILYSRAVRFIFPPPLLLLPPRRDQNGSSQHGPGDARPVCPGHPGQRHGGPDGRPLRHHLCHCHTNRCQ